MSQSTKVSRSLAALDAAGGVPPEQRVSIERRLKDEIQHGIAEGRWSQLGSNRLGLALVAAAGRHPDHRRSDPRSGFANSPEKTTPTHVEIGPFDAGRNDAFAADAHRMPAGTTGGPFTEHKFRFGGTTETDNQNEDRLNVGYQANTRSLS